jgi:ribA/ribD-fused uncharacterized protein
LVKKYKLKSKTAQPIDSFKGEYAFLSNFYKAEFTHRRKKYLFSENAYQAMKFTDEEIQEVIRVADTPAMAKRMGRKYKLRPDWEQIKEQIMYEIVMCKFYQNHDLEDKLLATGNAYLEEGNHWHDNIWGNCQCRDCHYIEGQNLLGKTLMRVRNDLRENTFFCKLFHSYRASHCFDMDCSFCDGVKDMVVNIKNATYDVYIGRGSIWGNPFRIGEYTREQSIEKYRQYAHESAIIKSNLHKLKGKVLGCYCKPLACHGDVLIEMLKGE